MSLTNLKEDLSSITEIIYFDPNQYLREKSSNPSKLKQTIFKTKALLEQLQENKLMDPDELFFLRGTLGYLYRVYGKPKNAIAYLELNLKYSIEESEGTREIISLIRLGEALKNDNQHEEALGKFNRALFKCNATGLDLYSDFALQHKGKCLLELKRVEEAILCFQEALEIRKSKGDNSLINSTEEAMKFAQGMLEGKESE